MSPDQLLAIFLELADLRLERDRLRGDVAARDVELAAIRKHLAGMSGDSGEAP